MLHNIAHIWIQDENRHYFYLFTAKLLLRIPVLLVNVVQFTYFRKVFDQMWENQYLHNVQGDSNRNDSNKRDEVNGHRKVEWRVEVLRTFFQNQWRFVAADLLRQDASREALWQPSHTEWQDPCSSCKLRCSSSLVRSSLLPFLLCSFSPLSLCAFVCCTVSLFFVV